jgi:methionyl-tRNA formyltransferase
MGKINWTEDTPELISRKLRAYDPWPGIYSYDSDGKRINFIELELISCQSRKGIIQEEFLRGRPHLINTSLT